VPTPHRLRIHLGFGIISAVINATIGAIVPLIITLGDAQQ
jgi:hypothetical protein